MSSPISISALDSSLLPSLPVLPISHSSPTPSSSNSDFSVSSNAPKRKRTEADESKPSKHPKASVSTNAQSNYEHLSFDPFNPHPGMSKEERKMARMIRNRTAAQASRDRKKEHVTELENRVKELEAQLSQRQALACPHQCAARSSDFIPELSALTLPFGQSDPTPLSAGPIDPSIITNNSSQSSNPPSTLSPAQTEYLSTLRIHLLEEENAQLKAQLELQLKQSAELKSGLLQTFSSTCESSDWMTNNDTPFALDQDLFGLILKEDELEQILSPNSSSTSLLDPALMGGEALPVTPSPLRLPHLSGPAPPNRRLVAREEVLSLPRIGRNGRCVIRSGWRWTLMWCWVAWKAQRKRFRYQARRRPSLRASLIYSMKTLSSLRPQDRVWDPCRKNPLSMGSSPLLSLISSYPDRPSPSPKQSQFLSS